MGVKVRFKNYEWCWIVCLLLFSYCSNPKKDTPAETTTNGSIHISVDETFKPVIDSQIKVFEVLYPHAKIIAHYKAEADCLKDLLNDSIRMIIITRGLTAKEEKF